MKRLVAFLAGASLVMCLPEPLPTVEPSGPNISGTIRHSSIGWYVIDDSAHTPTGFGQIETLSDRVRVWYDFPVTSVGSVQVTVDEAFSAAGVRVGASVGLEKMDIFFYMGTSQSKVNPALLTRAGANVWVTGWFHP